MRTSFMASKAQIKARKLFAKRVKRGDFRKAISKTKKAKSNPHNDDGYYITKEGSLFVLRQKRFKDRLVIGKDGQRKQHPHDVVAMGRTRAEIVKMRKNIGFSADQLAESES